MSFCTKCGNRLEPGLKFCTWCGAPVQAANAAEEAQDISAQATDPEAVPIPDAAPKPAATLPPESAPEPQAAAATEPPPATEWQALPTGSAQQHAPTAKSGRLPTVLILFSVLALVAVLGIGGLVYAGYKMKQKATTMLHQAEAKVSVPAAKTSGTESATGHDDGKPGAPPADPQDDASKLLSNLTSMLGGGDDDGDLVQSVSDKDPVEPCSAAPYPDQTRARIPLRAGTVITTAWGIKPGDIESRIKLESATASSISQTTKTAEYINDFGVKENAAEMRDSVCNDDLASGDTYVTTTWDHMPHIIHGITRLRLSDKSFNEVKTSGSTYLRYLDLFQRGEEGKPYHDGGTLTRIEPQDVPYPMIVNDERVTLATIHLTGAMASVGKDPRPRKARPTQDSAEIYVVDDPLDPLVLLYREKDPVYHDGKFRIEVVKIDFKTPHPVNIVEKQLTEQKRAVTYGIYFDFNKDTIKPESETVLKQIVQAMTDNPSWKLTVEGNTDNIGGDSYNLDLSKRRAAAVKQALVTRYHIAPDRLSTDGFGASHPVETNDTLEGRARNRRVELTRE